MSKVLSNSLPAGGFAAISKYNPHLWQPAQLEAIFVVRKNELADLQATLRNTPPDTVGQHVLLVGARGMGKSTLMQRLALVVKDDAELSQQWLALRFPEEQYTVAGLNEFWAHVLDALIDAIERTGHAPQGAVAALDAQARHIAENLPVAQQSVAYLQTIESCASARHQRLLLLVDNTDMLLGNIGKDAQWALRDILQTQSHLLWVGGSYQSLEANSEYHDAFLDFFRVIELCPLMLDEMKSALLALAEIFGGDQAHAKMQATLQKQPERLATLRQLSGGNPRITVMLYNLLDSAQRAIEFNQVRSDLEALLDDMTPLYKSRLDNLAATPRKLLAHLLEHWAPMALGELETASNIKGTSISPQLKRLESEGLIEKTTLHGTTRSGYQAAERFFNIWYLMRFSQRRRRAQLQWLVEFMRLWFSPTELQQMASLRMGVHQGRMNSKHPYDLELDHALHQALSESSSERPAGPLVIREQSNVVLHRPDEAEAAYRKAIALNEKDAGPWYNLGVLLHRDLHRAEEAEAAYRKAIALNEKDARPWNNLGLLLHRDLNRAEEAEAAYRKAIALNEKDAGPWNNLGLLLHRDLNRAEEAEAAYRKAIALNEKDAGPWNNLGLLLHRYLNRAEEAEAAYRKAIALNEKDAGPWYNLGVLLHRDLHRAEEAEAAYRKAIALNEKDARPWNNLGLLLHRDLNRAEEAEAAYRKAIALNEKDAGPWYNLGVLLHRDLHRAEEAEAAYRKAIALNEKDAGPWYNLGVLLHRDLHRAEEAEAAYRKAIALNANDAIPVANLACLLWQQNRRTEAMSRFKQVVALGPDDAHHLHLQAHLVLGNKQLALDALHTLVESAQEGNNLAFDQIKKQVWECSAMNLGETLADWMCDSQHAVFFQPFSQALYQLAGAKHKLKDLPQEVQRMADEVVRLGRQRLAQIKPVAKERPVAS